VEVFFDDDRLRRDCNGEKALTKRFNRQRAKLITPIDQLSCQQ